MTGLAILLILLYTEVEHNNSIVQLFMVVFLTSGGWENLAILFFRFSREHILRRVYYYKQMTMDDGLQMMMIHSFILKFIFVCLHDNS